MIKKQTECTVVSKDQNKSARWQRWRRCYPSRTWSSIYVDEAEGFCLDRMLKGGDTMWRGVGWIGVPKKKNGSILAVWWWYSNQGSPSMTWKDQVRLNLLEKKGEEPWPFQLWWGSWRGIKVLTCAGPIWKENILEN